MATPDDNLELQQLEEGLGLDDDTPLSFQDFSMNNPKVDGAAGMGGRDDDEIVDFDDTHALLDNTDGGTKSSDTDSSSMFSIGYYRGNFDVTTVEMKERLYSALKCTAPFYEDNKRPDLYGPFWIATTLIFLMGACGNLANYIQTHEGGWTYDFTKVTYAATMLYMTITVAPLMLYFALRRVGAHRGLVEIVSIFGYSLVAYLPTTILCVVPSEIARIVFVCIACALSAKFTTSNLIRASMVPEQHRSTGLMVMGAVVFYYVCVAAITYISFFSYSATS